MRCRNVTIADTTVISYISVTSQSAGNATELCGK